MLPAIPGARLFVGLLIAGALLFASKQVLWGQTAVMQGPVTVTNGLAVTQTDTVSQFPMATEGLISSGFLSITTLNTSLCDSATQEFSLGFTCNSSNRVPLLPSPVQTRMVALLIDDGGAFTDETTDANDSDANDFQFFPNPAAEGDAVYFLADHQFRVLAVNVGRAATTTIPIVWEYNNGASYVALSNVQDNTSVFTRAGTRTVSWDAPSDMSEAVVSSSFGYAVRARVTAPITFGIAALGTQVWYEPGVWRFFNDGDLLPNSDREYTLVLVHTNDTQHEYFPGLGGATTTDAAALEPGASSLSITIDAFIDGGSTGLSRYLMQKGASTDIRMNATTTGQIDVTLDYGATDCLLSASGVSSGVHTVAVTVTPGSTCAISIDEVEQATSTVGATFTDSGSDWQWVADGSVKYVNSIDLTIGGTQALLYQLNASTTAIILPDRAGTAQNALPSWAAFPTSTVGAIGALVSGNVPDIIPATDPGTIITIASTTAPFVTTTAAIQTTGFPGAEFISARATEQNVPVGFYWLIIAGVITLMAFMGALMATQNLWVAVLAGGVVIGVFVSPQLGILSVWSLVFYAFLSALVLLGGRTAGQV